MPLLITDPAPPTDTPEPPSPHRDIRRDVVFITIVVISLFVAWKLRHVLELIYVSALMAVVLMPLVRWIMNLEIRGYHPSSGVAIGAIIFVVFGSLTVFIFLGLPPVMHDVKNVADELPAKIPSLLARLHRLPLADKFGIATVAGKVENGATATAGYLVASLPMWLKRFLDLLTTIVLTAYFIMEGDHAYNYFLSFFSGENRRRLSCTLERADQRVSKWLLGQGLLMLILGVTSTIVFALLHVRYFFLLGIMMGLFNIIPIAGGVVTICIVAAVAALDSWTKMGFVFLFYFIYINIENAYLTPKIMKTSVDLMGLAVLIALLAGTEMAGVVGALIAVPTAALVAVLLDEYLVNRENDWAALT